MKSDKVYLDHMLECIQNIEAYTKNGKMEFMDSTLVQDAVIRNLEVIGEAAKRISNDLKITYDALPWREMAGLRDVLIHDYFGVDLKIVWNVIEKELPTIKSDLMRILGDYYPPIDPPV